VVNNIYTAGPRDENKLVSGAAYFEPLDAAVLLKHDAEVRIRLLNYLETRVLANLNVAMPSVEPSYLFLSRKFAHLLQSVSTDWKYLASLSNQNDWVVVVEYTAHYRHVGV